MMKMHKNADLDGIPFHPVTCSCCPNVVHASKIKMVCHHSPSSKLPENGDKSHAHAHPTVSLTEQKEHGKMNQDALQLLFGRIQHDIISNLAEVRHNAAHFMGLEPK